MEVKYTTESCSSTLIIYCCCVNLADCSGEGSASACGPCAAAHNGALWSLLCTYRPAGWGDRLEAATCGSRYTEDGEQRQPIRDTRFAVCREASARYSRLYRNIHTSTSCLLISQSIDMPSQNIFPNFYLLWGFPSHVIGRLFKS